MWWRGRIDESRDVRERIREAFTKAIAAQASEPIWAAIAKAMQTISTKRTIRRKVQDVQGITQEQLADALGATQSSISKWLRGGDGALVWENMIVAATYVESEAKRSGADVKMDQWKLPDLQSRLRHGIQNAMQYARAIETEEQDCDLPDNEVIECLRDLSDPKHGWTRAKLELDRGKRRQKLTLATEAIVSAITVRLGRKPKNCDVEALENIERKWMGAWLACQSSFQVVKAAMHEASA